jgi:hypothetical protein
VNRSKHRRLQPIRGPVVDDDRLVRQRLGSEGTGDALRPDGIERRDDDADAATGSGQ